MRVGATLEVETVLDEILQSARMLVGARYAAIATADETGAPLDFVTTGFTADEDGQFRAWEEGPALFERLGALPGPLRIDDFPAYVAALGRRQRTRAARTQPASRADAPPAGS